MHWTWDNGEQPRVKIDTDNVHFPDNFFWGTATAAHQVIAIARSCCFSSFIACDRLRATAPTTTGTSGRKAPSPTANPECSTLIHYLFFYLFFCPPQKKNKKKIQQQGLGNRCLRPLEPSGRGHWADEGPGRQLVSLLDRVEQA